jgi:hypothetical protein
MWIAHYLIVLSSALTATAVANSQPAQSTGNILARGGASASHRGVYEIELQAASLAGRNPYTEINVRVTFTRPDASEATVDAFYDGNDTFKARAYCDTLGEWRWRADSNVDGVSRRSGAFRVLPSSVKGKLRRHPEDPRQLAYDNGEWFLHLGDTGYRYVVDTEPHWKGYIDQAVKMGATKIRAWFARARHDVQVLFTDDRRELNLPYWQEIDRRVTYALETYPDLMLGLIPYAEDTEEIRRYGKGDTAAPLIGRYAQARFSAFPNVYWVASNDMIILGDGMRQTRDADETDALKDREVPYEAIDRIGRDMAAREPWGTLLTNHQSRGSGYAYVDAPWSDIIDLEDLDQVAGRRILEYRGKRDQPIVLDEDRYECYRPPEHDRYFFRRLMWASLLSGGSATYGGLRTYEPYEEGECQGVAGYFDAVDRGLLEDGAHDLRHIRAFFRDGGLTLVSMSPDDDIVGANPYRWKASRNESTIIVYLANPSGSTPQSDSEGATAPSVTLQVPAGDFNGKWFDPSEGTWQAAGTVAGGRRALTAPAPGDWVLLLRRQA